MRKLIASLCIAAVMAVPLSATATNGGAGSDKIVGTSGADRLRGGRGDDTIHSRRGADVVAGGRGFDVCYVQPRDVVRGCEIVR